MDSSDTGLLAISGVVLLIFCGFAGLFAYNAHLRSEIIKTAADPLYSVCAYDSSGLGVPPSCFTLLSLNKDLPQ